MSGFVVQIVFDGSTSEV